jgi:hypothetical protein
MAVMETPDSQVDGPDGGDVARDGLVLVKLGGFTGPHPAPLLLVEI